MRFFYGKQDVNTAERGQENCYLLTNGLGGFSSMTMTGSVTRNDHSFLMACVKAPNHRYNIIHRLSEQLTQEEKTYCISSQEFADEKKPEDGYRYLSGFSFEDIPEWTYQLPGVQIKKQIGMAHGENTAAVLYEIENRSRGEIVFCVTPFFQFVKKGDDMREGQEIKLSGNTILCDGKTLSFSTNGAVLPQREIKETYDYSYDDCDGRRATGQALANHRIEKRVAPGDKAVLEIVYFMDAAETKWSDATEIIESVGERKAALRETAGFRNPIAQTLAGAADQFIAKRESTGGETILAGYPFFEDWGRDTMIALPGCCISTGQYETAKSILRTFMANVKNGLMPNLFPEGENEPAYNTVDAALLFINCVYLYVQRTNERTFLEEAYPVMDEIVRYYQKGTDYDIYMDSDGLIHAGSGLDQVTWMDVRVGEILPTPRHGKPVEINAYWYNALRIMEGFSQDLSKKQKAESFHVLAEKVKENFLRRFWLKEKHCLRDVLSGTKADNQIRCNQIWAASLPFTMLTEEMTRDVVETVFEKLYTPYGLRTLAMEDEEFRPTYGGEQLERDLAYHQGTVWVFPMGAYYLAYLKAHHYSESAKRTVLHQLSLLEGAMREGCIGQLPEIYDGAEPSFSRGCFAQAWSVGEIIRVYELLER